MSKPLIKYFCFDLDGTLLNSKKNISIEARNKIIELKKNGAIIILASGRHFNEMTRYINELKLDHDDYAISCDGLYTYKCNGDLLFTRTFLSKQDLLKIREFFNAEDIYFFTSLEDYRWICSFFKSIISRLRLLKARKSIFNVYYRCKRIPDDIKIEKIRINNASLSSANSLGNNYTIHEVQTDGLRIEILHGDVNKYLALNQLMKYLNNQEMDSLLYFGNDDNDRECFQNIKYAIAMEDTPEDLKRLAFSTTDSSDENGVYKALIEYTIENKYL